LTDDEEAVVRLIMQVESAAHYVERTEMSDSKDAISVS
jgi:hypothetical protein